MSGTRSQAVNKKLHYLDYVLCQESITVFDTSKDKECLRFLFSGNMSHGWDYLTFIKTSNF